MACFASCALAFFPAPPVTAQPPPFPAGATEVVVPLTRAGNALLADVRIHGREAGLFLVDTGAMMSMVEKTFLASLNSPVVGEGIAVDVGGSQNVETHRLASFYIGRGERRIKLHLLDVMATDLSGWRQRYGPRFVGVIGGNVWNRFPFSVDYQRRTLTFYEPQAFAPLAGDAAAELSAPDDRPHIRIRLAGFPGQVLLDTGFDGALNVSDALAAAAGDRFRVKNPRHALSHGFSGSENFQLISLDDLQLLGRRFDGVATAFSRTALDGGRAQQPPQDLGVLGGSVMRHFRWTMNYPSKKLWARYQRDDLRRGASGQPADLRAEDLLGQTPLVVAIYNEDLQAISELVAAGADVNRQNRDHFTPLRFAAEGGSPAVTRALLAAGADPNARGASPETPLMVAVATGHQEVAGLLLQAGADPNAMRGDGVTALMVAATYGHLEAAQMLLQAGANPKLRNDSDETAIEMAKDPRIVALLKQAGG